MRITFLGPPGSGKGTQAQRLSSEFKITLVATGDILRNSIRNDTSLGKKVKSYLNGGGLVPDGIISELILQEIERMDSFLLDGFPRTVVQAERLEKIGPIDIAVVFQLTESAIISRLSQRKVCPACGKIYNLTTGPPVFEGICDKCSANLVGREDDRAVTVKKRLEIYKKETLPLMEYYRKKGVSENLNAEGDQNVVYTRLKQILFKNDNPKI